MLLLLGRRLLLSLLLSLCRCCGLGLLLTPEQPAGVSLLLLSPLGRCSGLSLLLTCVLRRRCRSLLLLSPLRRSRLGLLLLRAPSRSRRLSLLLLTRCSRLSLLLLRPLSRRLLGLLLSLLGRGCLGLLLLTRCSRLSLLLLRPLSGRRRLSLLLSLLGCCRLSLLLLRPLSRCRRLGLLLLGLLSLLSLDRGLLLRIRPAGPGHARLRRNRRRHHLLAGSRLRLPAPAKSPVVRPGLPAPAKSAVVGRDLHARLLRLRTGGFCSLAITHLMLSVLKRLIHLSRFGLAAVALRGPLTLIGGSRLLVVVAPIRILLLGRLPALELAVKIVPVVTPVHGLDLTVLTLLGGAGQGSGPVEKPGGEIRPPVNLLRRQRVAVSVVDGDEFTAAIAIAVVPVIDQIGGVLAGLIVIAALALRRRLNEAPVSVSCVPCPGPRAAVIEGIVRWGVAESVCLAVGAIDICVGVALVSEPSTADWRSGWQRVGRRRRRQRRCVGGEWQGGQGVCRLRCGRCRAIVGLLATRQRGGERNHSQRSGKMDTAAHSESPGHNVWVEFKLIDKDDRAPASWLLRDSDAASRIRPPRFPERR